MFQAPTPFAARFYDSLVSASVRGLGLPGVTSLDRLIAAGPPYESFIDWLH